MNVNGNNLTNKLASKVKYRGGEIMRVDGQGMALSFQAKREMAETAAANTGRSSRVTDKISLEDLGISSPNVNQEEIIKATATVNEAMKLSNYYLEFQLHQESGRYQVKVVDTQSQEVIREIPPQYILDLSAKIKQILNDVAGLLVDEFI